jgi:hypothetical protein
VWAYDHHPPSSADLAVAGGIVDPAAGSTSTRTWRSVSLKSSAGLLSAEVG